VLRSSTALRASGEERRVVRFREGARGAFIGGRGEGRGHG
jgi:hypothetical protein